MAHMVRGRETHHHPFTHAAEWLDDKLVPVLGPPTIGPFDDEAPHSTLCPLCGDAIAQHEIEREEGRVYLRCADGTVTETGRES